MSPKNSPPSSPPTAITNAAPRGTTKILAPTASRKNPPPIAGYTPTPTATASTPLLGGPPSSLPKKKTKKNKNAKTKVPIDFGVKPLLPNEELYSGDESKESPPPAVDTAMEEELAGEYDIDGVEARLSGMSIATKRPKKANGYWSTPQPGVSESLDATAGLGRGRKI